MKGAAVNNQEKGQRKLSVIILLIVVIIGLLMALVEFITDWMWFDELGYVSVFLKELITQLQIGVPVFIVIAIVMNFYLKRLRKNYFEKISSSEDTDMKKLSRYTAITAVVFGAVIAIYTSTKLWFKLLQFANSTGFGKKDPLFSFDVGFYIFKLDFLVSLNQLLIGIIVLSIVAVIIYYIILLTMHSPDTEEEEFVEEDQDDRYTGRANPFNDDTPFGKVFGNIGINRPRHNFKPKKSLDDNNLKNLLNIASGQLTSLGFIFFLMLGLHFFLKQFELLHDHNGAVYGAGFTDVNITLWIYRAMIVLSVAAAIATVIFIKRHELKKILYIPAVMIGIGVVGMAVGFVVQNWVVSPDELNKEKPYLERNIEFTQAAYQLDKVDTRPYPANEDLTYKDIRNNTATISNIRINDFEPVKDFYNQTQSIRQYYTFNDADVDRYMIDGKLTQTYLAVREIDQAQTSQTWLNQHLKYTHGFGLTLSKVSTVTASGQPSVLIKNIPPESQVKGIEVKQPRIYFGELTDNYSLVNTDEDEFDYPDGTKNKYNRYEGNAGIKLKFFNRLMFALREKSFKLLVSSNIDSNSKIIINRNVVDRVKKIMPYIDYENDPYAVTVDGNIYWIIDGYTSSSYYPYSEPYNGETGATNYVRNSIKVVVDAYNGDTSYYIVDKNDPIAKTYQKIYPKLFKDIDEMPDSIRAHIRYPKSLFKLQADIYTKYHMKNVRVFYQDEDHWKIANEQYGTKEQQMDASYYVVHLPGEKTEEFITSIPFTPRKKQNMTAYMIARNDGDNYGDLLIYQFPKSKTVYGPNQIEALIDQNTEISKDFSLWTSAGTKYSRGNLFVIPIEKSLLYVEPIYLEASNTAIPEVKRVIVAYGDKIAYQSTLGEALQELFGDNGEVDEPEQPGGGTGSVKKTKDEYIKEAQEAYDNAQEALKNGDWSEYGKYMDDLEKSLKKLA